MRFIYYLLILLFSFISGDSPENTASDHPSRVVTQIQVSSFREGHTDTRTYTEAAHMEAILNYLRLLDPYHKADIDPDSFRSNTWEILVRYSDGNSTTYRQIHRQYLQKDNGIWRQINGEDDLLFLLTWHIIEPESS